MKNIAPYKIQHIQLEDLWVHPGFAGVEQTGFYCVFWWKEIPLGQLFIEKGNEPAGTGLFPVIFEAIRPAIEYYVMRQKLVTGDYKKTFLQDRESFIRDMQNIFAAFLPGSLPASVDLSVVICTRNRSASLKECLTRLMEQESAPAEILVIDNAPTDESTRMVAASFAGVTYFREPRPGLDIARNAGAKLAKSSIVAYVDDDVKVHPQWAFRTWEAFSSKDINAMTGLVIAGSLDTEAQQIFEKFWSFNRGYQDKIYDTNFFDGAITNGPPVWEIGAGANMAFRKSLFEQVGYFDERLDVGAAGCSGDSEIWFRILANSGSIYYSPRSVVFHEHRKELKQLKRQLFYYMRGFAAAALIQQEQHPAAGYTKRLFRELPKSYLQMIRFAFPRYSFQNQTLFSEIRGVISGILFYYRNKNRSAQ